MARVDREIAVEEERFRDDLAALGEGGPPPRLDLDAVLEGGRRALRRRRARQACGTLLGAAAVAAGVLGATQVGWGPGPASLPATAPSPPPPLSARALAEQEAELSSRLERALAAAAAVPAAPVAVYAAPDGSDHAFSTVLRVSTPAGHDVEVLFVTQAPGPAPAGAPGASRLDQLAPVAVDCAAPTAATTFVECASEELPDGSWLSTTTEPPDPQGPGAAPRWRQTQLVGPAGEVVLLRNLGGLGVEDDGLAAEQQRAIASDPALRLPLP